MGIVALGGRIPWMVSCSSPTGENMTSIPRAARTVRGARWKATGSVVILSQQELSQRLVGNNNFCTYRLGA